MAVYRETRRLPYLYSIRIHMLEFKGDALPWFQHWQPLRVRAYTNFVVAQDL